MSTNTVDLSVPGMSCGPCEAAAKSEVGKLPGVETVSVDLDSKNVVVSGSDLTRTPSSPRSARPATRPPYGDTPNVITTERSSIPAVTDRSRRRQRWGDWISFGVTAVAVVSIAAWVIVRATRGDDSNQGAEISHVHGLGLNPADGSLIVATHHGSFRVEPGDHDISVIGDTRQDTMGFTVVGPDHFLGSGHPDLAGRRDGQPAQLGLIESTDAGATWAAVALAGEVDFHGLASAHDRIYGWDAATGRFMVSEDRQDWQTRSTVDLFSFAVDPADDDHIVAAGPSGMLDSVDGGRTWLPSEGPVAVALSWQPDGALWAADATGSVHRLDASGWVWAGQLPGEPQALLATRSTLYAATVDAAAATVLSTSDDGGQSWESITH